MVKTTYDFFVAGSWRNQENIARIVSLLRDSGHSAFCFLENDYREDIKRLGLAEDAMQSKFTETLPQDHDLVKTIFKKDLAGQMAADNFILVLPAGLSGHVEAGISYGLGKKCYAVGQVEKTEALYCIFDRVFENTEELSTWLRTR